MKDLYRLKHTMCLAVMVAALSVALVAQSYLPRTIHVWVDPHHGNDTYAVLMGVTVANSYLCVSGQKAPNDALNTSGAPLLHQPYPFKTVTGAVAYINSLQPTVSQTDHLPYRGSLTYYDWEYAIIHLLPGRYASDNALETQSSHNQLYVNGETFPIKLPNHVSIQGTSALDTVFERSRGDGPVFLIGDAATSTGEDTFIACVAFVGGDPDVDEHRPEDTTFPAAYGSAAIALSKNHVSKLRIDDCFFFGNGVGVLCDADDDEEEEYHEVDILNCTFAWNTVGIWSGDVAATTSTVGRTKFLLVNNIFDTSPPPLSELITPSCSGGTRPFPQRWAEVCTDMSNNSIYGAGSMTAFEGVDLSDLRVQTGTSTYADFNAYESDQTVSARPYDTQVAFPSMLLPSTTARTTSPRNTPPSFDISSYTGSRQQGLYRRGVLFVCDLFRNGYRFTTSTSYSRFATAVGCGFDLSPMDFRLAPAVADADALANDPKVPGTAGALNPLVDVGYQQFPITMENGLSLSQHPRALDLGSESSHWPFAGWSDFTDCEGFGNRRVMDHPVYTGGSYGDIDIGADELDLLIFAGYRYGTRTFTEFSDSQAGIAVDNRHIWTLGPPDSLTNVAIDAYFACASANWWATPGPAQYNTLNPAWDAWTPTAHSTGYYNPFVVDVTPHLLPDSHPYHAISTASQWPTNPVWQDCSAQSALQAIHNAFLYVDPTDPLPNPPGVYPALAVSYGSTVFAYLDGVSSTFSGHTSAGSGLPGYWPFGHGNWNMTGPEWITSFADWCQVRDGQNLDLEAHVLGDSVGGSSINTWNHVYPHKDPSDAGNSNFVFQTGGAERLSLELYRDDEIGPMFGYDGPSNLQTFMIWRQTED